VPTLWPVWHRWPYQELTVPPAYLSGSARKPLLNDKAVILQEAFVISVTVHIKTKN
jgi:hypothetical protein